MIPKVIIYSITRADKKKEEKKKYILKSLGSFSVILVKFESLKFTFLLYLNSAFGSHQFYWIFGKGNTANLIYHEIVNVIN